MAGSTCVIYPQRLARRPLRRGQFKPSKHKPGHDCARYQRITMRSRAWACRLPVPGRDNRLQLVTGQRIGAQRCSPDRACIVRCDFQIQPVAALPAPHFVRIDPVPMRTLGGFKQEMNQRARRARRRRGAGRRIGTPGFAKPSAFGMRRKVQRGDQFRRGQSRNSSLMAVLLRVCASTVLTITAQ